MRYDTLSDEQLKEALVNALIEGNAEEHLKIQYVILQRHLSNIGDYSPNYDVYLAAFAEFKSESKFKYMTFVRFFCAARQTAKAWLRFGGQLKPEKEILIQNYFSNYGPDAETVMNKIIREENIVGDKIVDLIRTHINVLVKRRNNSGSRTEDLSFTDYFSFRSGTIQARPRNG